jgi:hypothetical protein
MRPRLFLYAVTAALLAAAGAHGQQAQAPAELFPAKVLAYAEVRQPGQLAQEIASLFQGSLLADVPDSLARLHANLGQDHRRGDLRGLGAVGLALCPEVLREVGRIKGAAAALLAIDKHGEPEYLAVVLPGDSQAPTFLLRTYVTVGEARPIGKVEGVTLYRSLKPVWHRFPEKRPDKSGPRAQPPALTLREYGPVFAMMPGAVFIGSPAAVKDAIRRARGKGDGASLAMSEQFQQASKEAPDEPGLFAYADPPALYDLILRITAPSPPRPAGRDASTDDDLREGRAPEPAADVRPAPGAPWVLVAMGLNTRAFRWDSRSLTLSKGTLRFRQTVLLDPAQKSIVLDILPARPVDTSLLHYVPPDAVLAAVLSNSGGEKRWPKLLEFVDIIAKLAGAGRERDLPSRAVRQMEKELELDFARDVAGKISALVFALGNLQNVPVRKIVRKGPDFESGSFTPEIPALILVQAVDEEAARKLTEELLPKLLRAKGLKPAARQLKGQTIFRFKLGEHDSLHYGRHASTIVLGPFEDPVAQALAAGASKKGWLADPKLASRLKKLDQPVALAVAKPVSALMGFVMLNGGGYYKRAARPVPEIGLAPQSEKQDGPVEKRVQVTIERVPDSLSKEEQEMMKQLGKLLAKEELLVYSVMRKQGRIQAEATLGGLRALVPPLTDFAVEQSMRMYRMALDQEQRAVEAQRRAEEERRRADENRRRALELKEKLEKESK